MCVSSCVRQPAHAIVRVCDCASVSVCVYMSLSVRLYVFVYVHLCVCLCVKHSAHNSHCQENK